MPPRSINSDSEPADAWYDSITSPSWLGDGCTLSAAAGVQGSDLTRLLPPEACLIAHTMVTARLLMVGTTASPRRHWRGDGCTPPASGCTAAVCHGRRWRPELSYLCASVLPLATARTYVGTGHCLPVSRPLRLRHVSGLHGLVWLLASLARALLISCCSWLDRLRLCCAMAPVAATAQELQRMGHSPFTLLLALSLFEAHLLLSPPVLARY